MQQLDAARCRSSSLGAQISGGKGLDSGCVNSTSVCRQGRRALDKRRVIALTGWSESATNSMPKVMPGKMSRDCNQGIGSQLGCNMTSRCPPPLCSLKLVDVRLS